MAHEPGHTAYPAGDITIADEPGVQPQVGTQTNGPQTYKEDEITLLGDNDAPNDDPRDRSWYQPFSEVFSGINDTIADGFQYALDVGVRAPYQMAFGGESGVGLFSSGDNLLPKGMLYQFHDPDDPIWGATAVRDFMEYTKLVPPERDFTLASQIGEEIVWNLGSAIPLGLAARTTRYTFGMFEPIVKFVRNKPKTALLLDLGIALPQGTLAYYGGQWGGETGEQLGRIAGASSLLPVPAVASLGRMVGKKIFPGGPGAFTKAGRHDIAGEQMSNQMTEGQLASLRSGDFETPTLGGPYTTGEILDAGGLTRLRTAVLGQSEGAREIERVNLANRRDSLRIELEALRVDPSVPEARVFISNRINATLENIDRVITRAKLRAQEKINKIPEGESVDVASKIARAEMEFALLEARAAEEAIWKKIGDGVFYTKSIYDMAENIAGGTARLSGKGGRPDIHEIISEILGTPAIKNADGEIIKKAIPSILNKTETIDEIAALSSRITEAISKAKVAGDYRTAKRLGRLKDSIYHGLVPAGGSLEGLNEARKFSVLLNDTFTRGVIGDLLKTNTRGAISVDPSLTLEHLMFTGQKGKVAVDGLRTAAKRTEGGVDAVDKAITDFFISKFAAKTNMLSGAFDHAAATKFVNDNPALDLFPTLRAQMLDAAQGSQLASKITVAQQTRALNIENQYIGSRVLGEEGALPIKIDSLFTHTKNPIADANSLMRLAAKDRSGATTKGIQSAFYDRMINGFVKVLPDGTEIINPTTAVRWMNNKTNRQLVKIMYGEHGVRLLEAVVKGAQYQFRGRSAGVSRLPGAAGTLGLELTGNMGTILGARFLGKAFGHTLLSAGAGRRGFLRFYNWITGAQQDEVLVLLQRALEDPDFAQTLLVPLRRWGPKEELKLSQYATIRALMNPSARMGENLMQGNNLIQ